MRLPPVVSGQTCTKARKAVAGSLQGHSSRNQSGRADAGRCLAPAGLSHCVLLDGCSCTGTSFGREHFARVWTPTPTSPGLHSRAQGSRDGRTEPWTDPTVLSEQQGKTVPRGWHTHSRGQSKGTAASWGGWAHQVPSPCNDDSATEPLYKQFIYSKQQHRQTPYKHKGRGAGRDAANFGSEAH